MNKIILANVLLLASVANASEVQDNAAKCKKDKVNCTAEVCLNENYKHYENCKPILARENRHCQISHSSNQGLDCKYNFCHLSELITDSFDYYCMDSTLTQSWCITYPQSPSCINPADSKQCATNSDYCTYDICQSEAGKEYEPCKHAYQAAHPSAYQFLNPVDTQKCMDDYPQCSAAICGNASFKNTSQCLDYNCKTNADHCTYDFKNCKSYYYKDSVYCSAAYCTFKPSDHQCISDKDVSDCNAGKGACNARVCLWYEKYNSTKYPNLLDNCKEFIVEKDACISGKGKCSTAICQSSIKDIKCKDVDATEMKRLVSEQAKKYAPEKLSKEEKYYHHKGIENVIGMIKVRPNYIANKAAIKKTKAKQVKENCSEKMSVKGKPTVACLTLANTMATEEITAQAYAKQIDIQKALLAKTPKRDSDTGIIIGCAVGGLILIGGVAWYCHSKKAKKAATDDNFTEMANDTMEKM